MDRNKDLFVALLSDPCEERLVQVQTVLGGVDVPSITEEVNHSKERDTYTKWKDEDRFEIGDYARVNGNSVALQKFKLKFRGLKESTIRSFKTRAIKEIKDASKEQREVTQSLKKYSKSTRRPLLLGERDAMAQSYVKELSSRGTLVNPTLAIAAAKALIQKCPNTVENINIDSLSCTKNLFNCMGYVRRIKASSKVKTSDSTRHEI